MYKIHIIFAILFSFLKKLLNYLFHFKAKKKLSFKKLSFILITKY
jgi:hypothetical protein